MLGQEECKNTQCLSTVTKAKRYILLEGEHELAISCCYEKAKHHTGLN